MSRADVEIAGSGLAEVTCAWLLAARGHRVRIRPRPDRGRRPLLLGAPTLALLHSLWGTGSTAGPGLVTHELTHRRAHWGAAPAAPRIAAPAVVVDGARLAARLLDRLAAHHPDAVAEEPGGDGLPQWTVTAASHPDDRRTAGRRRLLAGDTALAPGQDDTTARLACTELAWLHLTPLGDGSALLQAMVPGPAAHPENLLGRLLAASTLAPRLLGPPAAAVSLPAAPHLHRTPATAPTTRTPGRLLVGAGAIRYDPLSGTGTAQALRTAVLATAVIDAAAAGTSPQALCAHYTARLQAAFRAHLATCARLYPQAFPSTAWHHEIDACR
ncbi:hypothetical protein DEJ51_31845 [Streptomyces venezuelae]|uniref:FAD-binding domain-containing protein n=1 Tax=Streptomyces venezuelae TaxID=54571 RepID=A0A5P2DY11_STRVZ|nr:hypothetical protein [Streptomyces venezuelae]QES58171.1 hypothetical protein DEJ51_31845 [Streptomyces venezuelae]